MKKEFNNLVKVDLIKNYIKNNALTIKEFCERCKINYSVYRRIIMGKSFKLIAIYKIAEVMDKEVCLLFEYKIP